MKLLPIISLLLLSTGLYSQTSEIVGQWKLERVETEYGNLTPVEKDYFLTISSDKLNYNLEVNDCHGSYILDEMRIINKDVWCTFTCCDGRLESIWKYIKYEGGYELNGNQLIITTEDARLFLERL
jgi:hypothetical protein